MLKNLRMVIHNKIKADQISIIVIGAKRQLHYSVEVLSPEVQWRDECWRKAELELGVDQQTFLGVKFQILL